MINNVYDKVEEDQEQACSCVFPYQGEPQEHYCGFSMSDDISRSFHKTWKEGRGSFCKDDEWPTLGKENKWYLRPWRYHTECQAWRNNKHYRKVSCPYECALFSVTLS